MHHQRTILRNLNNSGNLKYIKKQFKPPLTADHKKRLDLDGPDGFSYYCHDL